MPDTSKLSQYGGHQKALALFDLVVTDLAGLTREPALQRLVSQQIASADSIASNIEEGYGRGSKRDYAHFLIIARGSAQETRGRYGRLKHWISTDAIVARVALCDEIIAILTATIRRLRAQDGE
ncbi:MAG: 23S rRNA-intervening sequence protein [Verrucomicrobia bacterium]|nr:MAG: 23S rRNA-intervening sequence protein [Verrucomicrobiota bacterium]